MPPSEDTEETVDRKKSKVCEEDGSELFLNDLLTSGKFSTAEIQEKCAVRSLPFSTNQETGLTGEFELPSLSYSGYLRVEGKFKSNLFFWFFPSQANVTEAPLLLWLNGGPGSSSMKGVFVEHGPIEVNPSNEIQRRDYFLSQHFSVLYVDSPVGAGFSFTESEEGRARSLEDVNRNLLTFLDLWFELFPDFQNRDFYICGESFGGKYVPSLGKKIHLRNQLLNSNAASKYNLEKSSKVSPKKINLVGLSIGAPYTDPINQVQYGDFLYSTGLVDDGQRKEMQELERKISTAITDERWQEALTLTSNLILGCPDPNCLFTKFTGFTDNYNIREPSAPAKMTRYINYIDQKEVRSRLHAGFSRPFHDLNAGIVLDLTEAFFRSELPALEFLLESGYKVLIYASQLDILVPIPSLKKLVENIVTRRRIRRSEAINLLDRGDDKIESNNCVQNQNEGERRVWKLEGEGNEGVVAGHVTQNANLTFVELLDAGHLAFTDVPRACCEMMKQFVNKK